MLNSLQISEICVNFPCKHDVLYCCCVQEVSQCYSWLSISSGHQEFEKDKEVPERMGTTTTGEDDKGSLWQVTGGKRWPVHVQTQLLQDGVCLQIRGLHVQAHSTDTGSSGKHRWSFVHIGLSYLQFNQLNQYLFKCLSFLPFVLKLVLLLGSERWGYLQIKAICSR